VHVREQLKEVKLHVLVKYNTAKRTLILVGGVETFHFTIHDYHYSVEWPLVPNTML